MDENKKYELVKSDWVTRKGKKLYRIRALKNFQNSLFSVKTGDLGGYIQSECNLSQQGNCWVAESSKVYEQACVKGNALIRDNAEIFGASCIEGSARVRDSAKVHGFGLFVRDEALVSGEADVSGREYYVSGLTSITGNTKVTGPTEFAYIDFGKRQFTFYKSNNGKLCFSFPYGFIYYPFDAFTGFVQSLYTPEETKKALLALAEAIKFIFAPKPCKKPATQKSIATAGDNI